jgi:endo-1,4-beta-xylanase
VGARCPRGPRSRWRSRTPSKLLWDSGRRYALATVIAPTLDESGSNLFEQDSVEIFVDPFSAFADNLVSAARVVPGGYVVEASIQLDTRTAATTWQNPTSPSYLNTSRWGAAQLA